MGVELRQQIHSNNTALSEGAHRQVCKACKGKHGQLPASQHVDWAGRTYLLLSASTACGLKASWLT
jgi:hypothetical protein